MRPAIVAVILLASLVVLPSGAARPADADVSVWLGLGRFGPSGVGRTSDTRTERREFIILVVIDTVVAVEQRVAMTIDLPQGLRWGSDAPDPSEGCTGTAPVVCTGRVESRGGVIDEGWCWDVIAEQNGAYEITAAVRPTDPDPNLANNATTFRFEVAAPTSGSGGGAGGGSGGGVVAASVAAGAVKLAPARPKAGSTVVASVRVTRGGSPVRPTGVACTASLGRANVKGSARAASGVASCLFKTPKNAKGKRLAGSVSFRAGGTSFTKRFATRLE